MADILKGFTGTSFVFLVAWIFPSAALVGLVAVFVSPVWEQVGLPKVTSALDSPTALLVMAFVAVSFGLLGSAASTPLYRVLEGYTWPERIQRWAVDRRRRERIALVGRYEQVGKTSSRLSNQLYERLSHYPASDDELVPTRLGNAIRVLELYGANRYCLDSQTWWTELYSVVPAPIRQEVDGARAVVDFFVAALYVTALFAILALATFATELALGSSTPSWTLLALGIACLGLPFIWYRVAIWACSYWRSAVQAMVNVGRAPLASSLGFRLPRSIEQERELWQMATDFVNSPFQGDLAKALDKYREVDIETDATSSKAES